MPYSVEQLFVHWSVGVGCKDCDIVEAIIIFNDCSKETVRRFKVLAKVGQQCRRPFNHLGGLVLKQVAEAKVTTGSWKMSDLRQGGTC